MRQTAILLLLLAGMASRVCAAPTIEPELAPPPSARLPLDLPARDEAGRPTTLRAEAGGAPVVLAFADYRCTVLCGTALGLLASLLPETGLEPGRDFALVVIGLNPRDGPPEAAVMRQTQFSEATPLAKAAHLLVADPPIVAAATAALGYRAVWRAETDRFDHPLAVMVLARNGRLASVLPGLGLDADTVRDAVVGARSFTEEQLPLLRRVLPACFGLLPDGGARKVALVVALAAGLGIALAGVGGAVLLLRAQRQRGI